MAVDERIALLEAAHRGVVAQMHAMEGDLQRCVEELDAARAERDAARRSALEEAAEACLDEMEACATGKGFDKTPYLLCAATIRMMKERP